MSTTDKSSPSHAAKSTKLSPFGAPDGYSMFEDQIFTNANVLKEVCELDPATGNPVRPFACQAQWCVQAMGKAGWPKEALDAKVPYTLCTMQNLNPYNISANAAETMADRASFYRCVATNIEEGKSFEHCFDKHDAK